MSNTSACSAPRKTHSCSRPQRSLSWAGSSSSSRQDGSALGQDHISQSLTGQVWAQHCAKYRGTQASVRLAFGSDAYISDQEGRGTHRAVPLLPAGWGRYVTYVL